MAVHRRGRAVRTESEIARALHAVGRASARAGVRASREPGSGMSRRPPRKGRPSTVDTQARNRAVLVITLSILAIGALALLAVSFAYTPETIVGGGPLAGLRAAPCPGCVLCGMSRAFCAASHLRLDEAFAFNPLVAVIYPLVWALALGGPWLAWSRSRQNPMLARVEHVRARS